MSNPFGAYQEKGGGDRPESVFRGQYDGDGNPVYEPVDWEHGRYAAPLSNQYTLKVTGFTEPKENRTYPKDDGTIPVQTAVELEIVGGTGDGFRFFWSYQTFSLAAGGPGRNGKPIPPSNLCRIYIAAILNGAQPSQGVPRQFDELIGATFTAYVNASTEKNDKGFPKYAKVAAGTIAPATQTADGDPFAAALAQAG